MTVGRGQRRSAAVRTFLIGDIRGYTRFTAQHGDEAASRLAATFAEIATEAVEAWDGELVELRGDEVLAVFDSARQALRCAIELQDALGDETRTRPELPLTVGIGLDAGEAVPVGDGYRGAALNMAARLCSSAAAGEIIATADLVHLAGPMPGLAFEALPAKELKGIERPVDAMRITDASGQQRAHTVDHLAGSESLPAELQPIVPLAGRSVELRWLRWHWRRARHGHGRTIVVSGPPGIGKTRLSAELATIVHAEGGAIRYLPSAKGADAEDLLVGGAGTPTLLVVDDLDAAPTPLPRAVVQVAKRAAETATLLLLTHREEAAAALVTLVEPLAGHERRRILGPLEVDGVRAIAAIYAGRAIDDLPMREVLAESGGVPGAIHRVAAGWARSTATRRLGASADRTEAGRRSLREAEDELIDDVADLELVRDRSRRLALDQPSDGVAASAASAITICPYKGLASFEAPDAQYYFGRERLVAELVARLVGSGFLGLIGASGSGKSSALRAGLLPALAAGVLPGSERWRHVLLRPADHPIGELGRALRRVFPDVKLPAITAADDLGVVLGQLEPGAQVLLAIDQFEEVFTATRDEAERSAFLDLLTAPRPGLKVVVTMRADHYGHCAPYPALARLIGSSQVLVGPLTTTELEAVIEAPAERVGLRVEPGLTRELVSDAGTEPGVLPLLSTALLELWQARANGWLTLDAYRAGGGLKGAVARLAESAFAELDPAQTRIARAIFLRLAGPGEGEGVVRRRVPLTELDADRDPAVARVLEHLVGARLLTSGDGYVEVAHEALLREWPRLQGWLEEDASGRRLRLHLMGAVRDWEGRGREPADLYRGARLSAALDWAAEHHADMNQTERDFLEESRVASQREVDHERRINRRLRVLLAGAAVLLVVAVGTGVTAILQADAARSQAAIAQEQTRIAQDQTGIAQAAKARAEQQATIARARSLSAAAIGALAEDPSLSKLLAVSAGQLVTPDGDIETALHKAWAADGVIDRYTWPADREMGDLRTELSPDGRLVLASTQFSGADQSIAVADLAGDRELWHLETASPLAHFSPAFFSDDGAQVIVGQLWAAAEDERGQALPGDELGILVLDAHDGHRIRRIDAGPCGALVLDLTTAGVLLQRPAGTAPACFDKGVETTFRMLDLATGKDRLVVDHAVGDWAISHDGRWLGYSGEDFVTRVVDTRTHAVRAAFDYAAFDQADHSVRAMSRDGSRMIFGDRPLVLVDVDRSAQMARLQANGVSLGAVFAHDTMRAYTSASDGTLSIWDGVSGDLISKAVAIGSGVPSAPASGDRVLLSDYGSKSATLITPRISGELGTIATCRGRVPGGSFRLGGSLAAVATVECEGQPAFPRDPPGVTTLIDVPSRSVLAVLPGAEGQTFGMSPDGSRIVRAWARDHIMQAPQVLDARTGKVLVELEGTCPWDIASSAPSRVQAGPTCAEYPDRPFPLWPGRVTWAPDGRLVVIIDDAGYAAVWDSTTGRIVKVLDGLEAGVSDATFTPDARTLAISLDDGTMLAVDTVTWAINRRGDLKADVPDVKGVALAGYLADGSLLALQSRGSAGGWLLHIDAATFRVVGSTRAVDARPRAIALNADRTLVVVGSSDGIVRVRDGATGDLLHQVRVDGQVSGVAFIDDEQIAVAAESGDILIFAIDRQRLWETVRDSLIRGYTPEECQRFAFDPCPTLAQLQG